MSTMITPIPRLLHPLPLFSTLGSVHLHPLLLDRYKFPGQPGGIEYPSVVEGSTAVAAAEDDERGGGDEGCGVSATAGRDLGRGG
jgi:hypothetical protein